MHGIFNFFKECNGVIFARNSVHLPQSCFPIYQAILVFVIIKIKIQRVRIKNVMTTIAITIDLPQTLLDKAHAAGITINTSSVIHMIEAELVRTQAAAKLLEAMTILEGSLTPEEIDVELARAKIDRIAHNEAPIQK